MREKKISIIIPVYNSEDYLSEAINSIMNNSFQEFEVICIDDGSSDESLNILNELEKRDERIKVYTQSNSGPSKARNLGLEKASGEYIVFMDSDDILPKDSLMLRYEAIEESNSDVVIGGTNRFNKEKEWRMEKHYFEDGEKDILKDFKLLRNLGPCNKIYRASLLKGMFFNEELKYAEDVAFVLEALVKAKKIYTLNKLVYKYREREGSLTFYKGREVEILRNSIKSLKNVFNTLDKIEMKKENKLLKINYLERVIDVDIWPSYRSIKEKNIKKEMTLEILNMLTLLDKKIIGASYKIKIFIAKNLYENYFLYLQSNDDFKKEIKVKIEKIYEDNLEAKSYLEIIINFFYKEKKQILFRYLIKEKIKRLFKDRKST
ncbi:MAG: glycosyltransferase family 2 protein [Clostridium sp.]|uniref:glycosyltransferase family 2 protein n=1 Tax=Clostridium sp. TaxID=1506 RepID=UPI003F31478C